MPSATLRSNYSHCPFSLILRREHGEDDRELATRTRELISVLARELPEVRIAPAVFGNKLRNRIELTPPVRDIEHGTGTAYVWHEKVPIATSFVERTAVVQRIVSALDEHFDKLDWDRSGALDAQ